MATATRFAPNARLAHALRTTASRLELGAPYQWGHFGACNCGHLAQTVTRLSQGEIHRAAVERAASWGDATIEYCATSGYPIDHIIGALLGLGLTLDDLRLLEELGDPTVCSRAGARYLDRNVRADVVRYLRAWAELVSEPKRRERVPTAA